MKALFITGTGTGVGKTLVTGLLGKYLKNKGLKVITQKWIQTGSKTCQDINSHIRIIGLEKENMRGLEKLLCPYRFRLPASAHLAAKEEGKKIDINLIKKSFKQLSKKFDTFGPPVACLSTNPKQSGRIGFVIVEGIGGVLVPIDGKHLVIDIAKELKLPVLIVAQNKLGAINHTLLTIEAIKQRKMKILGIIFNNAQKQDKRVLRDNPKIIEKISGEKILAVLPWDKDINSLYKKIVPAAKKIFK